MAKVLFIGTNWLTKQIIAQILFDDSEEEALIMAIGDDDNDKFWNEFPRLKEWIGDERVNYQQMTLDIFRANYQTMIHLAILMLYM